jgi:curved DNA-binding protein CbpA
MSDHYAVLGLRRGASAEEIKTAYLRLARRHHPDRPGGNAATFARCAEAFETLGDAARRGGYDAEWLRRRGGAGRHTPRSGAHWGSGSGGGWDGGWQQQQQQQRRRRHQRGRGPGGDGGPRAAGYGAAGASARRQGGASASRALAALSQLRLPLVGGCALLCVLFSGGPAGPRDSTGRERRDIFSPVRDLFGGRRRPEAQPRVMASGGGGIGASATPSTQEVEGGSNRLLSLRRRYPAQWMREMAEDEQRRQAQDDGSRPAVDSEVGKTHTDTGSGQRERRRRQPQPEQGQRGGGPGALSGGALGAAALSQAKRAFLLEQQQQQQQQRGARRQQPGKNQVAGWKDHGRPDYPWETYRRNVLTTARSGADGRQE